MSAGNLLGYLDRWSVRPGETLVVHASCSGADSFDAELVRVIQGDTHPDAPGYREERVAADLGGPFEARHQPIETGSYALVEDAPQFASLGSFVVHMLVWPTTPGRGAQTLMARRDPHTGHGFELYLDEHGAVAAEVGTAEGGATVCSDRPLIAHRWYAVSMAYDDTGRLQMTQRAEVAHPRIDDAARVSVQAPPGLRQRGVRADLTIAARAHPDHAQRRHFNGRIDTPELTSAPAQAPIGSGGSVFAMVPVAKWDFSIDIPTQRIVDTSPNGLHGHLVNLPTRGVAGHAWDGSSHAWPHDARHYTAIHFHDDDLYDAGWPESFRLTVPADLASGVYALRLHAGDDEFYLPFAVRPPKNTPRNPVTFLLPTASYLAYANNRIGLDLAETELICGRLVELTEDDLYMQEHPELGLCFYDLHSDGSGVYYSSRLRPVMNLQPKFVAKLGGAGSNVWQFNADTHILGWLDKLGTRFDVVSDEDLHEEGVACLGDTRVLVTGTHPEYYSAAMRDALDEFCARGGRLMYLGGNGFYWRISFHPELPGVIECRKSEDGIRAFAPLPGEYYASFTGEYTGLWRRNGRPPNTLAAVGMVGQGFDVSSPYLRTEASHDPRVGFMFEGIDEQLIGDFGLCGGGAAGIEVDAADPLLGTPPHTLVVASSQTHTDLYIMTPEDMLDPVPGLGGSEAEIIRADLAFFETPSGGAVFSTGSIAWAGAMAWNGYDNHVARLTENVLRRFVDPQSF